jgi:hypothetical protein
MISSFIIKKYLACERINKTQGQTFRKVVWREHWGDFWRVKWWFSCSLRREWEGGGYQNELGSLAGENPDFSSLRKVRWPFWADFQIRYEGFVDHFALISRVRCPFPEFEGKGSFVHFCLIFAGRFECSLRFVAKFVLCKSRCKKYQTSITSIIWGNTLKLRGTVLPDFSRFHQKIGPGGSWRGIFREHRKSMIG